MAALVLLLGCHQPEPRKDWDTILREAVEERGLRAGLEPIRCCADHGSLFDLLNEAFQTCRLYHSNRRTREAVRELDAVLDSFHRTRPCIDSDPVCRAVTDLIQRMERKLAEWLESDHP